MPKTPNTFTLDATVVLERETKNYVVYSTRATDALLPIHLLKTKLPTPYPPSFMLTLTARKA